MMCDKERIVSYVYEELDRAGRALVEAHLETCPECREEVAGLRSVRADLTSWAPPQPEFGFHIVRDRKPSWRERWIPAFGLAAAAILLLAVASAVANLDVSYGSGGLHVRTGWGKATPDLAVARQNQPQAVVTRAPAEQEKAKSDEMQTLLASLDRRVRQLESTPRTSGMQPAALKSARQDDAEMLRRVHDLLAQSESRQQQELALRIAQVIRDFDAQRIADLNRIQQGLGRLDAMTTQEAVAHRDLANYIVASSRQK